MLAESGFLEPNEVAQFIERATNTAPTAKELEYIIAEVSAHIRNERHPRS